MSKLDRGALLITVPVLCLAACGGHSSSKSAGAGGLESSAGAGGLESSAGAGGLEPAAGAGGIIGSAGTGGTRDDTCPIDLPGASELAATPRANTNLELLALKFSSGVVAEQAVYDRLVRDVALITAREPSVADIDYYAPHDGKQLFLQTDARTLSQMQAGTYRAWSCLNGTYGLVSSDFSSGVISFATLTLKGIYNLVRVSKDYAALPGVQSASANVGGGDGSTICVVREDSVWHYVFDRASGDCLAGCTEHEYLHFTVSSAGTVVALGQPSAAELPVYASTEACR